MLESKCNKMTRDQVIRRISYLIGEDVKEEFEEKEWQAAIKDESTFYISSPNIELVKIMTYVKNDELIYDVLMF